MHSHEARGFLRFGAIVCVLSALVDGADALLPQDAGVVDITSDLLATLESYVLVGLAWGLIALRPGPLAKVAVALLLLNIVSTPLVWLATPPKLMLELLPWLRPLAISALAATLAWGRPRDLIVALIAAGGAIVVPLASAGDPLRPAALVTTALALAALFELSRGRAPAERPASTLGAWRQTEAGARLLVMGERGRMVVMIGGFVLGMVLHAANNGAALAVLLTLGNIVTLGIGTAGLVQMRSAPAGRPWVLAALGMAIVALLAVTFEILGWLRGDEFLAGQGALGRLIGQGVLPSFAALALGALGTRAGLAYAKDEAKGTAWTYLLVFTVTFAMVLARDLGGPTELVTIGALALFGLLLWAISRLAALGTEVKDALPAGAANDLFDDERDAQT